MTRTLLFVPLLPSLALAADGPDYSKMKTDQVFEQLCASCHGKDLSGGVGGSLIDGEWKHGGSDEELLNDDQMMKFDAAIAAVCDGPLCGCALRCARQRKPSG